MRIVTILFIMVVYNVMALFIVGDTSGDPALDFPTFDVPSFDFESYGNEGSCGTFDVGECIEFLARVMRNIGIAIRNIGIGIIGATQLIFNLVTFVIELSVIILASAATGIDGAPWYVNLALFTIPFVAGISMIIYKMVRSGEDES